MTAAIETATETATTATVTLVPNAAHTCTGQAMGTSYQLVLVGGPTDLIGNLERRLHRLEGLWSRFRTSSEISALNRDPDRYHIVSAETVELIERGVAAWVLTKGACDPSVLETIVASGYDRTIEECGDHIVSTRLGPAAGCGGIELDRNTGLVRLGHGVGFDPGGIGKGLAADMLVRQALAGGASGALVNVGGDVVCRGQAPAARGWVIEVAEPAVSPDHIAVLAIAEGAVATSTSTKRRWSTTTGDRHHLVDPFSGANTSGIQLATVIARDGWYAEAITKQIMVTGDLSAVEDTAAEAIIITDGGTQFASAGVEEFVV